MRRGATLVETILAVTILAMTAVIMLALCPRAIDAARHNESRSQAYKLAQTVLERHRLLTTPQLNPQPSRELSEYALDSQGTLLTPFLEIRAGKLSNAQPALKTRELRVKVAWNEKGQRREIEQSLLVTELKR